MNTATMSLVFGVVFTLVGLLGFFASPPPAGAPPLTMEHGHGNHLSDDWSSTAYWYQRLPTAPFDIPPVEARLPLRPIDTVTEQTIRPEPTNEQRAAREQAARRLAEFRAQRRRLSEERFATVRRSEQGNQHQAADIRSRFDRQG